MAFCTECGTKLPENARFCTNCGTLQKASSLNNKPSIDEAGVQPETEKLTKTATETVNQIFPPSRSFQEENRYYTPPQATGGFVPPYQSGSYYSAPQKTSPYQPKKNFGKTVLIVVLSVVAFILIVLVPLLFLWEIDDENAYIGYWESEEADFGNGQFTDEYLGNEVDGMMGLQINTDGTMYLGSAYVDDIINGKWEQGSNGLDAKLNDQRVYLSMQGKDLLLFDGSITVRFERSSGDINSPGIPSGSLRGGSTSLPKLPGEERSTYAPKASVAGSGDVANGLFHVAVVGAEETVDYNNMPTIRFYYELTNNSDYSISPRNVLDYTAKQSGDALDITNSWQDSIPEYYNYNKNIRPGITILCICEFEMNPQGGSIDFTIYGWETGMDGDSVTATYFPDRLPGRPAPYVIKPVAEPQWTLGIPAEGTLDESYYVSVKDAQIIEDVDGDTAIRVFCYFTNNSEETISMCAALHCLAYQDGVQLEESYAADNSGSPYADVRPGSSVSCSMVFKLRNQSSPVEAEAVSSITYDAVGQTYYIK